MNELTYLESSNFLGPSLCLVFFNLLDSEPQRIDIQLYLDHCSKLNQAANVRTIASVRTEPRPWQKEVLIALGQTRANDSRVSLFVQTFGVQRL